MPLCHTSQTQTWVRGAGLIPLSQGDTPEQLPMNGVGKGTVPGLLCPAASRTWPGERLISGLRLNPRVMAGSGASAASVPTTGGKTQKGLQGPQLAGGPTTVPPQGAGYCNTPPAGMENERAKSQQIIPQAPQLQREGSRVTLTVTKKCLSVSRPSQRMWEPRVLRRLGNIHSQYFLIKARDAYSLASQELDREKQPFCFVEALVECLDLLS